MFEIPELDYSEKKTFYSDLQLAARGLVDGESDRIANCANLSALLFHSLPQVNWVGFYLMRDGELVVGPFQGKPACVRIAIGEGVCGTAVAERQTQLVADVETFPGHIPCDADSRSEIVIPLISGDSVIGVLDIDAPVADRFDQNDREGLEGIARLIY